MPTNKQVLNPEGWVDNHADYLYNYAMSRLYSSEIAEDMVQETFLSALSGMQNFQGMSSERTWLVSILKHKIIDHYRKKSRSQEQSLIDNIDYKQEGHNPFNTDGDMKGIWNMEHAPHEWNIDALKKIEDEEFMRILHECIDKLPAKFGAIFIMRMLEELETEIICKENNVTTSNLWVILHRAKLQMRECMEKNWL